MVKFHPESIHSQNRLLDFINRGSNFPTRKEYSDYLAWAARFVQGKGVTVVYGENVVGVCKKDTKTIEIQSTVLSTGKRVARLTSKEDILACEIILTLPLKRTSLSHRAANPGYPNLWRASRTN